MYIELNWIGIRMMRAGGFFFLFSYYDKRMQREHTHTLEMLRLHVRSEKKKEYFCRMACGRTVMPLHAPPQDTNLSQNKREAQRKCIVRDLWNNGTKCTKCELGKRQLQVSKCGYASQPEKKNHDTMKRRNKLTGRGGGKPWHSEWMHYMVTRIQCVLIIS